MALRKWLIAAVTSSVALAPVSSQAACTLANMLGTWKVYAVAEDDLYPYWVKCTLKVDRTGRVANTTCQTGYGSNLNLSAGKFALASGAKCTFTAQFKLTDPAPMTSTNKITQATMSMDKGIIAGVGLFNTGSFVLTMIKLP